MKNKIFKTLLSAIVVSQLGFSGINLQAQDLESSQKENKIRIDIVSDVVCPWCAIGYKRLSLAIDELDIKDKVDITWHPFELNPNMPREGKNADEYLKDKLNLTEKQLREKRNSVTQLGKESGFKFNYTKDMLKLNTLNAHILLNYAKKYDKQTQLKVRLQEAYFGEGKNISSRDVLYKELQAVGLNADEAIKRLDDAKEVEMVRNEEAFWKDRGVYAIPTMVFDNKIARMGANKVETYKEILTQLLNNNK